MTAPTLTWHSKEHAHTKSSDWFWALGIVAVAGAVTAILLHDTLFALLIIIGSVTLGMSANRPEREYTYTISPRGISVGDTLYPYKNLSGFWINEHDPKGAVLLVDAQQPLMPHLVIPLPPEVDKETIQDYLLDYLPEEELYESPAHKLFEMLGV